MNLRLFFLILSILFLYSCETDFDVTTSYKKTMIVYGLLDPSQDVQYIRINKAYLGEGDAVLMGSHYDSLQYPLGSLEVSLYLNQDSLNLFFLDPVVIEKEPGDFSIDSNIVYSIITDPILFSDLNATYHLNILDKTNNQVVRAQTNLISGFNFYPTDLNGSFKFYDITSLPVVGNYRFKQFRWYPATYKGNTNNLTYQFDLQFNYLEDDVQKNILWSQPLITSAASANEMMITLDGQKFFNFIQNNISEDPSKIRKFTSIDIHMSIASPELTSYIDINQPISGISQERLEYTNIENGLGIFSSRSTRVLNYFSLDRCTLEHLLTLNRNFILTELQGNLPPCQ